MALYPDESTTTTNVDESVANALVKRLQALGFKLDQSQKAVAFISETSAFTKNFTESLTPLEASIEYLLLHTPEVDLPERFMPAINSSKSFITDTHSGTDNLKMRWFQESMVKQGGWPLYLVKEELAIMPSGVDHPETLVSKLGMRLLGMTESLQGEGPMLGGVDPVEVDAYGGTISPRRMTIPLPISPFTLHIFTPDDASALPRPPAVHISSQTAPAYIRLHILSHILRAAHEGRLVEAGETFVGACLRIIEEEWADIEDNGPPDIAQVLKHIPPHRALDVHEDKAGDDPFVRSGIKKERSRKADDRTDLQVKADFEKLCASQRYRDMLIARQKLPAFSARVDFLTALEHNRVVVVVGETGTFPFDARLTYLTTLLGSGKTTQRRYCSSRTEMGSLNPGQSRKSSSIPSSSMDGDHLRLSWSPNLVGCRQSQLLLECPTSGYPMDLWDTPFGAKVKRPTELNSSFAQRA